MREEINVKSVRAKMLEPGYGYIRVRKFQERTGEDLAKALKRLVREGRAEGPGARPAQRPGRAAQPGGCRVGGVPAQGRARRLHRWPHAGCADAPHREPSENYYAPRRRLPARSAGRRQEGADGGAGRWRHGVGVRNRRRRAAGSQARDGARRADVRQGLGADDPAARQQHRIEAHDGALLHAVGALDPGEGHRARHRSSTTAATRRTASAKRTSSITSTCRQGRRTAATKGTTAAGKGRRATAPDVKTAPRPAVRRMRCRRGWSSARTRISS